MSIQSSINQAISLGGLLYTQTKEYKAKQEIAEEKTKIRKAEVAKQVKESMEGLENNQYNIESFDLNKARKANKRAANRVNALSEQKQSAQRYMMLLKEDKE